MVFDWQHLAYVDFWWLYVSVQLQRCDDTEAVEASLEGEEEILLFGCRGTGEGAVLHM